MLRRLRHQVSQDQSGLLLELGHLVDADALIVTNVALLRREFWALVTQ